MNEYARINGQSPGQIDPAATFNRMSRALPRPASVADPHVEAPKPLNAEDKKTVGERIKESKFGKVVSGVVDEHKKGFSLVGSIMLASAEVSLPKEASGKEIAKFSARLLFCPFKTGVGLLLSANVLLGMVLATPIIAVAKAFPKETEFLFRARNADDEHIVI